jgi:excinuclease ABC subunit C
MDRPMTTTDGDSNGENTARGIDAIRAVQRNLPGKPGVYRMIGDKGAVLYVGKARDLKKRVASYTKMGGHTNRIARMIAATREMDIIITNSETEALLLEANLIKRFKPHYNVILRDDKSFPYILLATGHEAVRLRKHRGARNVPGHYFGPFASGLAVNRALNTLQKAFLLRTCADTVYESRTRPCLLYQIKRCAAPCTGEISAEEYGALVRQARDFLGGKSSKVQAELKTRMEEAAEALEYERAAALRDRIAALTQIQAHQDINPRGIEEADVIAAYNAGGQTCIQVFFFRAGQNWGNRAYFPRHDRDQSTEDVLDAFLAQVYDNKPAPRLILLSHDVAERPLLAEALSLKAERRVTIEVPRRGGKRALVDHALTNAREAHGRRMAESASQRRLLDALTETFDLDAAPERIEVYDNSHIQGANPVGAMIVAGPEGFERAQYRKFNIKGDVATPGDDVAMTREVMTRRFAKLVKDQEGEGAPRGGPWPDLVLIDGGATQLTAATEALAELGIGDLPLVAIAKGPDRTAGRERFYMKGRGSFTLPPSSPVLYYLQRLRDEAHRFAIGSHRARRKKDIGANPLDGISGIGARRKRALLAHFGSAREVARAAPADLEKVEGISKAMARRIHAHFQDGG